MWRRETTILVSEDFTTPLSFNHFLIHFIAEKSLVEFKKFLEEYEIRDAHNARDCDESSLLHIAAACGSEKIAKYLVIALGFEVNLQNVYGQTALMISLRKLHFSTAKILLELNADIWACDTFGLNALQIIISADAKYMYDSVFYLDWVLEYWEIVSILFNKLGNDESSDSEKNAIKLLQINCPMTHVIFVKNLEVMRIMIKKGSPINVKDRYTGSTALHLGVEYSRLDAVKMLLNYQADLNISDKYRRTPIMCIYEQLTQGIMYPRTLPPYEIELVNLLLQHKNKLAMTNDLVTQLYPIFRFGSIDAVRLAIAKHDDDLFLKKNKDNFTLLHVIAENSHPGITELVKGRKLDLNCTSIYGETALGHALDHANCDMVDYLASEGAITDIESAKEYPERRAFVSYTTFENTYEEKIKCKKIVLEYGLDQEVFSRNFSDTLQIILYSYDKKFEFSNSVKAEPLVAQIAIRESLKVDTVPEKLRAKIESYEECKTFYYSCLDELQEAKTWIMFGSTSVFEFLSASYPMISVYARDRSLVSILPKLIAPLKLNTYYKEFLQKRYSKICYIVESREKAEAIISSSIGELYEYNAIVTRKIIDFLDDKDVQNLLRISNFDDKSIIVGGTIEL